MNAYHDRRRRMMRRKLWGELLEPRHLLFAGGLDQAFDYGGVVAHPWLSSAQQVDMVIDSGGGSVVVGTESDNFSLWRFRPDGSLDGEFGDAGQAQTWFENTQSADARAVAIQADGKILVAGTARVIDGPTSTHDAIALARYLPNGQLDIGFHDDGRTTTSVLSEVRTFDLLVQDDGKTLVLGIGYLGGANVPRAVLVRYTSQGVLDPSFGGDGRVDFAWGDSVPNWLQLAQQSNGTLVVAGNGWNQDGDPLLFAAQLTRDGLLDGTFATGGVFTLAQPDLEITDGGLFGVQSDNSIVLGGEYTPEEPVDPTAPAGIIVRRITSRGEVDSGFGGQGQIVAMLGYSLELPEGSNLLEVQADDGLLFGVNVETSSAAVVGMRFTATGYPDPTFGGDGRTVYADNLGSQIHKLIALPDGRIRGLGLSPNDTMAIVGLLGSGELDPDFRAAGWVEHGFLTDNVNLMAAAPDGSMVVVGKLNGAIRVRRFLPTGELDAEFGEHGATTWSPAPGQSIFPSEVVLQPDGRIIVVGTLQTAVGHSDIAVFRFLSRGGLDPEFHDDGLVTTRIRDETEGQAVVLQRDGKVVVAGSISKAEVNGTVTWETVVVRYKSDGVLDETFDADGKKLWSFGNNAYVSKVALALQLDQNIVIVGVDDQDPSQGMMVARLTTGGSLDGAFGKGGMLALPNPNEASFLWNTAVVGVQPNGAIVVGSAWIRDTSEGEVTGFTMGRLLPDGRLDESFGGDGVTTVWTTYEVESLPGRMFSVTADGSLIFAANRQGQMRDDVVLLRWTPDGVLDDSFSKDGWTAFTLSDEGQGSAIDVLPDGRIALAGQGSDGSQLLVRWTSSGDLDPSLRAGGWIGYPNLEPFHPEAYAVQGDGKTVIVGIDSQQSTPQFVIWRLLADGAIDGEFGDHGRVNVTFYDTYSAVPADVVVQPDGKIVVVGWTRAPGTNELPAQQEFAIARLLPDGGLDPGFHDDGLVTTRFPQFGDASADAVALQSDGKIVVGGTVVQTRTLANNQQVGAWYYAVARYQPTGTLDTSFDTDGRATVDFGVTLADGLPAPVELTDLEVQSTGATVVVGGVASGKYVGVARLTATGQLDPALDTDGKLTVELGGYYQTAYCVRDAGAGRFLVGGLIETTLPERPIVGTAFVLRYLSNGTLDPTFAEQGKLLDRTFDDVQALELASDGRLLVVGNHYDWRSAESALVVARYAANGSVDTTFDGNGRHEVLIHNGLSALHAALTPLGDLAVLGVSRQTTVQLRFQTQSRGAIEGVVWHDVNENTIRDTEDLGLPGQLVYLDLDNNQRLDIGEPYQLTDFAGRYRFGDLLPGAYVVRQNPQGNPTEEVESEVVSAGVLSLGQLSLTTFVAEGTPLRLSLLDAEFGALADLRVRFNGVPVASDRLTRTAGGTIELADRIIAGRNRLEVSGLDRFGLPFQGEFEVWGGNRVLQVEVRDEAGQLVKNASVVAALPDHPDISVNGVTGENGRVTLANLPDSPLWLNALNATKTKDGMALVRGGAGSTTVVAATSTASSVANNDFSRGLEGWSTSGGNLELVPRAGSTSNSDLRITLANAGSAVVTRTFTPNPDTRSISVRYKLTPGDSPAGQSAMLIAGRVQGAVRGAVAASLGDLADHQDQLGVWREIVIPVGEDHSPATLSIVLYRGAEGDAPAELVIGSITEHAYAVENAQLLDLDGLPLRFFSADPQTDVEGGQTLVAGSFEIRGPASPEATIESLWLEIAQGETVAKAQFVGDLSAASLGTGAVQATAKYERRSPIRLFALSREEAGKLDISRDSRVTLQIRGLVRRATGAIEEISSGDLNVLPLLARYTDRNRYSKAERGFIEAGADIQEPAVVPVPFPAFGDDWVLPSVRDVLRQFSGVLYNDFSNMHGGVFPPHGQVKNSNPTEYRPDSNHGLGTGVDVKFGPLPPAGKRSLGVPFQVDDQLAEELIVKHLDSPAGQHLETVLVTMKNTDFAPAIDGVTLCDGRKADQVVQDWPGHGDHFHWLVAPVEPPRTMTCKSDLKIEAKVDKESVQPGERVEFSFKVQLLAKSNPATQAELVATFDAAWEKVEEPQVDRQLLKGQPNNIPRFDPATHRLTVPLGTILGVGSQHEVTVTIRMRAKGTEIEKNTTTTVVVSHAGEADPDVANNQVSIPVKILANQLIRVVPTIGLKTAEAGTNAPFTIVLTRQPTADVTIRFRSSDVTEGVPAVNSVKFTRLDWDRPQQVMVRGIDDNSLDGDVPYYIETLPAESDDPQFKGVDSDNVDLINLDDEMSQPSFTVSITDSPDPVPKGGMVHYEVSVTNVGSTPAPVTDLTFWVRNVIWVCGIQSVRVSQGRYTSDGAVLINAAFGALQPGEVATLSVTIQVCSNEPANTFRVDASTTSGVVVFDSEVTQLTPAEGESLSTAWSPPLDGRMWRQIVPAMDAERVVNLAAGQVVANIDFANAQTWSPGVGPLSVAVEKVDSSSIQLQFSKDLRLEDLGLYAGWQGLAAPADMLIVGQRVGAVAGSWLWDEERRLLTWLKSGGPLSPDTYRVTLRGSLGAFADVDGELLDGDGDGNEGGDFVADIAVAERTAPVVTLPDIARGPGQPVGYGGQAGWPVSIDNAAGLRSLEFDLRYDPTLLQVNQVVAGVTLPADWTVAWSSSSPGTVHIRLEGGTTLTGGSRELFRLLAEVPGTAPLGAAQVLRIEQLHGNGGQLALTSDAALHKVAYAGDVSGNRGLSALDASLVLRASLGTDSGFTKYPWIDPVIVGDVTGDGRLTSMDAVAIARRSLGLNSDAPAIPSDVSPLFAGGPDPTVSVGQGITAAVGQTISVPIVIDNAENLLSAELTFSLDPQQLAISGVALGGMFADHSTWQLEHTVDATNGLVRVILFGAVPVAAGGGELLTLTVTPVPGARGEQPIRLVTTSHASQLNEGLLALTGRDGSVVVASSGPGTLAIGNSGWAATGSKLRMPIEVSDAVGWLSAQLAIEYDANTLQSPSISVAAEDLGAGWLIETKSQDGKLEVAMFNPMGVSGSGRLFELSFDVPTSADTNRTKVRWTSGSEVNDGAATVNLTAGEILVVRPELSSHEVPERLTGATVGRLRLASSAAVADTQFASLDERFVVEGDLLRLKPGFALSAAAALPVSVRITSADSQMAPLDYSFSLTVTPNPFPWQHPTQPLDVNRDGIVAPVDVLQVINQLNSPSILSGTNQLPLSRDANSTLPYYDVNGDGYCTPQDVLRVINYLNVRAGVGEGEGAGVPPTFVLAAANWLPSLGSEAESPRRSKSNNRRVDVAQFALTAAPATPATTPAAWSLNAREEWFANYGSNWSPRTPPRTSRHAAIAHRPNTTPGI